MHYVADEIKSSPFPVMAAAMTETWWDERIEDAQVQIPGYTLFRADREQKRGGGSALLVHGSLIVTDTVTWGNEFNNLVGVYVPSCHTILASIYRTGDFRETRQVLQEFIDKHSTGKPVPDLFLLGDLNLPQHNWDTGEGGHGDADEMSTLVDENFLAQMVTEPTRGANILDVILTNRPNYFLKTVVETTRSISDHKMVTGVLGYNMTRPIHRTNQKVDRWSFNGVSFYKTEMDAMRETLSDIDWDLLFDLCEGENESERLTTFTNLLTLTILQVTCANAPPKKTSTPSSGLPWKDRALTKMKSKLRRINRSIEKLKKKGASNNRLKKMEKRAAEGVTNIKDYIIQELNKEEDKAISRIKEDPRAFYSFAKRKKKVQSEIGPLLKPDGSLTDEAHEKAEMFQSQYVKVFSRPEDVNVEEALDTIEENPEELENINISTTAIEAALKELKPLSAAPRDEIPAVILRECSKELSYPLLLLWKSSFTHGFIPEDLKSQQITPIFKKGNKTLPENYRPVALTSHVTKTFERVVRKELTEFVERTGILNEEQHGFRTGRSTLTQLLHHYDAILEDLNAGIEVDVAYIDFAKAFDKVDIEVLLAKLHRYGIRGNLLRWIKAFLTGRTQTVILEGVQSRAEPVISSVIQGSVLGPLLFIIYIADLVKGTSGNPLTFADDTKIRCAIKDIHDHLALQKDLDRIATWSRKNNMLLHEHKYEILNYTLNKTRSLRVLPFTAENYLYYNTTGQVIEPTNCVKDLGILMSSDGSWGSHIGTIAKEARRLAGWVLGIFKDRSRATMMTLLKSLIRPKLEYCSPLWSPCKIGDIQKLEEIQRYFTRRVDECAGMDYWDRLKQLKILSLQRRRERYMVIQVWKIRQNLVPNSTGISFYDHPRHGPKAKLPGINHKAQKSIQTLRECSFGVRAVQIFNRMPSNVRQASTLNALKVELGNFLAAIEDHPPTPGYRGTGDNSLVTLISEGK